MSEVAPFPAERTAVVTGAASPRGIGRATAARLAAAGWSVAVVDLDEEACKDTAAELAVGTGAAVVFPDYDLSPEAKYPTAIEQVYAVADWLAMNGAEQSLDPSRVAVAGDSVGGNMATVTTILAKQRGGVSFLGQLLFYPVTDARFDTASYEQFAEGYFLARDGMKWFWDQYTTDPAQRAEITASPLRASTDELAGLPQALIIVGEADVLRDEGEAYGAKLRQAGVPVTVVRYAGITHDFVGLNPLRHTMAAEAAINQGIAFLSDVLGTR